MRTKNTNNRLSAIETETEIYKTEFESKVKCKIQKITKADVRNDELSVITRVDDSCGCNAFSGVCVCLFVCLHGKTETAE